MHVCVYNLIRTVKWLVVISRKVTLEIPTINLIPPKMLSYLKSLVTSGLHQKVVPLSRAPSIGYNKTAGILRKLI